MLCKAMVFATSRLTLSIFEPPSAETDVSCISLCHHHSKVFARMQDNVNRSATEVRTAVSRSGGKMADVGSVLFNFSRQVLEIRYNGVMLDSYFACLQQKHILK